MNINENNNETMQNKVSIPEFQFTPEKEIDIYAVYNSNTLSKFDLSFNERFLLFTEVENNIDLAYTFVRNYDLDILNKVFMPFIMDSVSKNIATKKMPFRISRDFPYYIRLNNTLGNSDDYIQEDNKINKVMPAGLYVFKVHFIPCSNMNEYIGLQNSKTIYILSNAVDAHQAFRDGCIGREGAISNFDLYDNCFEVIDGNIKYYELSNNRTY